MEIPSNTFELLAKYEEALRASSIVERKTVVNTFLEIKFVSEDDIRGALMVMYTDFNKSLIDEFESVNDIPACIQGAIDSL